MFCNLIITFYIDLFIVTQLSFHDHRVNDKYNKDKKMLLNSEQYVQYVQKYINITGQKLQF
jgi:hypothetical protein